MIVRFNYQSVLNHSEMYKSITRSVWGRNASEAQIVEGQCIFWTETERQVFVQKSNSLLLGVPKKFFNPIRSCHVFAYISANTRTCALKNLTFPNYKFRKGQYAFSHKVISICEEKNKLIRKNTIS